MFNLGTGIPNSVLDVIHTTEKVTGKAVAYQIYPRRQGDVVQAYADPQKAKEILGRQASKTLEDAIRDMWRFETKGI